MNIGKFCPLPLCTLIGSFRIYLYIVSLVVILSNWVCDNWVYRFPNLNAAIFFGLKIWTSEIDLSFLPETGGQI